VVLGAQVKITDFDRFVGHGVGISPENWAKALLLGNARVATNSNRSRLADRGEDNQAVDLLGTLGELLLLHFVQQLPESGAAVQYMKDHLFDPGGGRGVVGADLEFLEDNRLQGIDVKTFDCLPNKRFFAINSAKHLKLAGYCTAYMGLIAPAYGRRGIVARLIPYSDVSAWSVRSLRVGGNPSQNLEIGKFFDSYISDSVVKLNQLRTTCFSIEQITGLAARTDSASPRAELIKLLPHIEDHLSQSCDQLEDRS
jgi:hypothetical protein